MQQNWDQQPLSGQTTASLVDRRHILNYLIKFHRCCFFFFFFKLITHFVHSQIEFCKVRKHSADSVCVCFVRLEGSSAPALAAMCGPDCDDVMDDVSNSH